MPAGVLTEGEEPRFGKVDENAVNGCKVEFCQMNE